MSQYKINNSQILKEQCFAYLGGKRCRVCSTDLLPIVCYDFHHNKGAKEEEISKMIRRKNKLDNELKEELGKCVILCSNCHRQVTAKLVIA